MKEIIASFLCAISLSYATQPVEKNTLLNGWFSWDPYQYIVKAEGIGESLNGLDIELVKAITEKAGKKITYQPVSWKQHQLDLKEGKRDFAAGATFTPERAKYAYFSIPYRYEENSLFVRRDEATKIKFKNIATLLAEIKRTKFRVGVLDGFAYADPIINQWLNDPANQSLITRESDDSKNLKNLVAGKIDGFFADRIVGATLIWRSNLGTQVTEVKLGIKTPIHLMFSKKTTPISLVEKFNTAIKKIQASNQYRHIITWYLYPVLLLQTVDTAWFHVVEIIGTIAFAISGLVIAYRDRATLFGAFIFAMLPSLGGGIIRDVIFNRKPVGVLQSPSFLLLVIGTVLSGFFILKIYDYWLAKAERQSNKPMRLANLQFASLFLNICDALGLAAFTVSGIVVSVLAKVSPLWLWGPFFAFLTGAGGGILRDLLSKNGDIVSLRGDIYAEIAIIWGFILAIFLTYEATIIDPDAIQHMVFITVIGAFTTRLIIFFNKIPNIWFYNKS